MHRYDAESLDSVQNWRELLSGTANVAELLVNCRLETSF